MKALGRRPIRLAVVVIAAIWMILVVPLSAASAPYAAMVMDARNGRILHAHNADTRLHPASLTKMMTLYVVFEAVENGEIGLDTVVTVSRNAASEPPSKLGLRTGQKIRLRYLIRAAAVKSANDAATALAEAIEGSLPRFARRMNRTAKAIGMTNTHFKNANGLTQAGHLSTARDMTLLGRQLFYDWPEYYNLFSRITANAGGTKVYHTNRKLLRAYRGADGIKTGYTRAAGFNLVASARRGGKRVIATVFGGRSVATRNARVVELLDMGFRSAPGRVAESHPRRPAYLGPMDKTVVIAKGQSAPKIAGKTVRLKAAAAVARSLRPQPRPEEPKPEEGPLMLADAGGAAPQDTPAQDAAQPGGPAIRQGSATATAPPAVPPDVTPEARPDSIAMTDAPRDDPVQEVVSRVSTSGGHHWGINVGRYPTQYTARQVLVQTALGEMATLDGALRKVVRRDDGFDANFMGLNRDTADRACRRLQARNRACFMIGPG